MAIPASIYFEIYTYDGVVLGVKLINQVDSWIALHARQTNSPLTEEDGLPLTFSEVENPPFEAILRISDKEDVTGKGIEVVQVDKPIYYTILFKELPKVLIQGEIVNGFVRGVWRVVKGRRGYGLSMVQALPWQGFDVTPASDE